MGVESRLPTSAGPQGSREPRRSGPREPLCVLKVHGPPGSFTLVRAGHMAAAATLSACRGSEPVAWLPPHQARLEPEGREWKYLVTSTNDRATGQVTSEPVSSSADWGCRQQAPQGAV